MLLDITHMYPLSTPSQRNIRRCVLEKLRNKPRISKTGVEDTGNSTQGREKGKS